MTILPPLSPVASNSPVLLNSTHDIISAIEGKVASLHFKTTPKVKTQTKQKRT